MGIGRNLSFIDTLYELVKANASKFWKKKTNIVKNSCTSVLSMNRLVFGVDFYFYLTLFYFLQKFI